MLGLMSNEERYRELLNTKKEMAELYRQFDVAQKEKIRTLWLLETAIKDEKPFEVEKDLRDKYAGLLAEIVEIKKELTKLSDTFYTSNEDICKSLLKEEGKRLDDMIAEYKQYRDEMNILWRDYANDEKNLVKKQAVYELKRVMVNHKAKIDETKWLMDMLSYGSLLTVNKIMHGREAIHA